jgi:hypothetical protein
MSRSYEMRIQITDFDESKLPKIEKACLAEWPFESEDFSIEVDAKTVRTLTGNGIGSLCGGEDEDEFSDRLAKAIWTANGRYCEVEVQALYLEELPYEHYVREEDDYQRLMGKAMETQNETCERLVS